MKEVRDKIRKNGEMHRCEKGESGSKKSNITSRRTEEKKWQNERQ